MSIKFQEIWQWLCFNSSLGIINLRNTFASSSNSWFQFLIRYYKLFEFQKIVKASKFQFLIRYYKSFWIIFISFSLLSLFQFLIRYYKSVVATPDIIDMFISFNSSLGIINDAPPKKGREYARFQFLIRYYKWGFPALVSKQKIVSIPH